METVWRTWGSRQSEPVRDAQAAFLGFCRRYVALRAAGDAQDRDGPRPVLGEQAHPQALDWWRAQSPERQQLAVEEFQICGKGTDWAFARTERQIIERAAHDWGGLDPG